METRTT